jgi:LmbE family N-acetylglucosaminyl deacetylase
MSVKLQKPHLDTTSGSEILLSNFSGRLLIVSPHLDDAVLSLGGAIARHVRLGSDCTIVTVFAGNPECTRPAGPYDRRCGFLSAGEAAASRRREDRKACALVGAKPVWLPFGGIQYDRINDAEAVWTALEAYVDQAQIVLLPGFPLVHPDHLWVTQLVWERVTKKSGVGFYAEQPYAHSVQAANDRRDFVADIRVQWVSLYAGIAERFAKGRACRAYWSQFRTLGCHLPRRWLMPELFWTVESLARPLGGTSDCN